MPLVENHGVRIHYEVEGPGEALVIQHGFTSSNEAVRLLGYSDSLKNSYQIILIDTRSHGVRNKLQTPETYGLQTAVILRSYFKIKEGDQESRIKKYMQEKILQLDEKLHGILPSIHELLSLEIENGIYQKLEPQLKREKTFEALRDLFVCEIQNRPIIIVVEDLHWIDKTSEEFLSYLIEWLANTHILLILLYRPEYTHSWGSKSYYSQLGLNQLTSQSSAELIRAILYDCDIEPELESLILNRSISLSV